jgi:lysyl-tRNA synthetase class 2
MLNESIKPKGIEQLQNLKPRLKFRSRLLAFIRQFFFSRDFIEVETPLLIPSPAPEEYIEAPKLGDLFLRTSPELEMKRLMATGYGRIFQIGPCFRKDEYGSRHRPEFTMLEWYEEGADYSDLLDFTREMLIFLAGKLELACFDFRTEWQVITVKEAFEQYAGISPEEAIEKNCFEELLVDKIEPALPADRPVVLKDYPARFAALAKLKEADQSVAERWELYLNGIEIANTYTELVDSREQLERFQKSTEARKTQGLSQYPESKDFMEALEFGIPPSGGCALGIDRLAMVLQGQNDIAEVMFPH